MRVHPDLRSPVTWLEVHATCTETPDGSAVARSDARRHAAAPGRIGARAAGSALPADHGQRARVRDPDHGPGRPHHRLERGRGARCSATRSPRPSACRPRPSSRRKTPRPAFRQQEIDRALSRGHSKDERWHVRKDGTRFFGSGLMMRMDGDDETSRLLKILRDRTLEEQARTALAESQERLRLATDAAGLGVFEWNLETGTGLLGEHADVRDLRSPPRGRAARCGTRRRRAAAARRSRTARHRAAGAPRQGRTPAPLSSASPTTDERRRFLELWGRFRTRRRGFTHPADWRGRRRDRSSGGHEAALIEADRRKDAFLATLAHELRNPLAPIRHALEILRRAEHDPALTARARTLMERQLSQMVRLIDDLLDLSRITLGKIGLRHQIVSLDGHGPQRHRDLPADPGRGRPAPRRAPARRGRARARRPHAPGAGADQPPEQREQVLRSWPAHPPASSRRRTTT